MIEAPSRGRGPSRILYWFRTPPGVRVGRVPLDDETKRRLEALHPGVQFDWRQLQNGKVSDTADGAGPPPGRPQHEPPGGRAAESPARRRRRDRRGADGPTGQTSPDEPAGPAERAPRVPRDPGAGSHD